MAATHFYQISSTFKIRFVSLSLSLNIRKKERNYNNYRHRHRNDFGLGEAQKIFSRNNEKPEKKIFISQTSQLPLDRFGITWKTQKSFIFTAQAT
jgi:hypothetical protein